MVSTALLDVARKTAQNSEGVGPNFNYKVGAILFKKKRLLKAKSNSYKTHPSLRHFTPFPHLHAESACIFSNGLDNCSGLNLLVVRVRQPNNQLTMAKPCKVCTALISDVGINKVWYSNWNGELICE